MQVKLCYDGSKMKKSLQLTTLSAEETMELGIRIGQSLKGGEVIELNSDLGGGKTTLTKGIVLGVGSSDLVSSPTFTISNIYSGGTCIVHHYDFYRLGELGLMSEELRETLSDPEAVSIIEWAGEAHKLLPEDKLIRIVIEPLADNENARLIRIAADNPALLPTSLRNKE